MGIVGGEFGYRVLKLIAPEKRPSFYSPQEDTHAVNIKQYFGDTFYDVIKGKTIIDFGCGRGNQSIDMALNGASKVIGIDIQEDLLDYAKQNAIKNSVEKRCSFVKRTDTPADILISKDAFEHFDDPLAILKIMSRLIKPDGYVLASFGETWFHPYGGHFFSVFPWSHLIFTENAQIRWRSDIKSDGAKKFSEVAGGLNQLTIHRFERIVQNSPFYFDWIKSVPIKGIPIFKTKIFREFGSSIIRCKLKLKDRSLN